MRVAGIDPSLTHTGVALIVDGRFQGAYTVPSKGKATDTLAERQKRLRALTKAIVEPLADAGGVQRVVIEGPAYNSRQGSQHDRSGLWWMLVDHFVSRRVQVIEVTPTLRAKYATGRGNAGKDQVIAEVTRRYPPILANNDEVDAFVLAAMGARLAGEPLEGSLPQTHLDAVERVRGQLM